MKKILLLLFFILISAPLQAQFDLNSEDVSQVIESPTQKAKPQEKKKKKKESMFSFMNFSFKKAPPKESLPGEEKTFLEKLEDAAKGNDPQALSALGYIYLYGDESLNIKPDYSKTFDYYSQAALLNDVVGLNNLANLYYAGIGVEKNKDTAAKIFYKSAELGSSEAAVNLAFMYLTGDGIVKSKNNAAELFKKAAAKNDIVASYMLGLCYYYGVSVKQDSNKAFNYVSKAAKEGFDEAQFVLARMYMNGHGVPQNYGQAVALLNRSLIQDNLDAMYGLANVLANGAKYPKDAFKAHIYYNLSAVRGLKDAITRRAVVEKELKIEDILEAQTQANSFVAKPTKISSYIRSTFGKNLEDLIKN